MASHLGDGGPSPRTRSAGGRAGGASAPSPSGHTAAVVDLRQSLDTDASASRWALSSTPEPEEGGATGASSPAHRPSSTLAVPPGDFDGRRQELHKATARAETTRPRSPGGHAATQSTRGDTDANNRVRAVKALVPLLSSVPVSARRARAPAPDRRPGPFPLRVCEKAKRHTSFHVSSIRPPLRRACTCATSKRQTPNPKTLKPKKTLIKP
jgi:hypothetical protein